MRSLDFHPSPTPPVSARDFVRYADRWVLVRAGKVWRQASTHDELMTICAAGPSRGGDRFLHLPPLAPPTHGRPAAPAAPRESRSTKPKIARG